MSKLTLARALTALIAKRVVRFTTLVACISIAVIVAICVTLVYFFSSWWWLLLVPFVLLFGIFLFIRFIVVLIIKRIHSEVLSSRQSRALNEFVDKVWELLEARATPVPLIILICIKDLMIHKDVTTIKNIISSSASLKHDYQELEKLF